MSEAYIETGIIPQTLSSGSFITRFFRSIEERFMIRLPHRLSLQSDESTMVMSELASHGLSNFQLESSEAKLLFSYLHVGEHIKGVVHGHVPEVGGALFVATDSRLMYLHETPLYRNFEEFPYDCVTDVTCERATRLLTTIRICTWSKSFRIEYVNPRQAEKFAATIETYIPASMTPLPLENALPTNRRHTPGIQSLIKGGKICQQHGKP